MNLKIFRIICMGIGAALALTACATPEDLAKEKAKTEYLSMRSINQRGGTVFRRTSPDKKTCIEETYDYGQKYYRKDVTISGGSGYTFVERDGIWYSRSGSEKEFRKNPIRHSVFYMPEIAGMKKNDDGMTIFTAEYDKDFQIRYTFDDAGLLVKREILHKENLLATSVYSDFRKISGMMLPFQLETINCYPPGKAVRTQEWQVNPELPEDFFEVKQKTNNTKDTK